MGLPLCRSIVEGHERLLFIDDEQTLVSMGKTRLERLGYEVVTVTSSVEALALSEHLNEEQAQAMGIRAFLMKPFVLGDLAKTVRTVLHGRA